MLITIRVPQDTARVFYSPINSPFCTEEVRLCDIVAIRQEREILLDKLVISKEEQEDADGADTLEEAR